MSKFNQKLSRVATVRRVALRHYNKGYVVVFVEAKVLWIKQTQHEDFRDELVHLKGSEVLPKKKRLNNLSPYFDSETGLIRVGGRIHKTSLPEETKYPVILPHQNRFIALLIQKAHEK